VTREFVVLPDANAVATATADRLIAAGQAAIADHGHFYLTLTGGSTPQLVCPLLVVPPRVLQLDWTKVDFFFGDERAVPARHPDSNYNLARETLLDYLPRVGPGQVHRMIGEAADLDAAARAYQALVNRIVPKSASGLPAFDFVWLGMGPDGHTASLFPGTDALAERERLVIPNWVPQLDAWRLTLTYPILNAARMVNVVATGEEKAWAVRAMRDGTDAPPPAGLVDAEETVWLVDQAAATG
jgi:6-phosphogluconolactonase